MSLSEMDRSFYHIHTLMSIPDYQNMALLSHIISNAAEVASLCLAYVVYRNRITDSVVEEESSATCDIVVVRKRHGQ